MSDTVIIAADAASALDVDRETARQIVAKCSTTPFLVKLWNMLDEPENALAIEWDATGDSFEVKDPVLMSRDVLPKHFRHNNFSSFQRQLNYFGFRKTGKGKGRGCVYTHEDFCLRRPHDVLRIRRKTNTGGAKGHHTNKCSQLLGLSDISPLNTAAAAGTAINGRAIKLKVSIPTRHQHGTRRAVRIKKQAVGGGDVDIAGAKRPRGPDFHPAVGADAGSFAAHASPLSSFSGPVTPLSATDLPTHTSKRPRTLAATAAANAASQYPHAAHDGGFTDGVYHFDMDPCLSPLSPLRLTEPALGAGGSGTAQVGTAGDMQAIFDGLSAEPFSPLLALKTPKTPRAAGGFTPRSPAPPTPGSPQSHATAPASKHQAHAAVLAAGFSEALSPRPSEQPAAEQQAPVLSA